MSDERFNTIASYYTMSDHIHNQTARIPKDEKIKQSDSLYESIEAVIDTKKQELYEWFQDNPDVYFELLMQKQASLDNLLECEPYVPEETIEYYRQEITLLESFDIPPLPSHVEEPETTEEAFPVSVKGEGKTLTHDEIIVLEQLLINSHRHVKKSELLELISGEKKLEDIVKSLNIRFGGNYISTRIRGGNRDYKITTSSPSTIRLETDEREIEDFEE